MGIDLGCEAHATGSWSMPDGSEQSEPELPILDQILAVDEYLKGAPDVKD